MAEKITRHAEQVSSASRKKTRTAELFARAAEKKARRAGEISPAIEKKARRTERRDSLTGLEDRSMVGRPRSAQGE